MNSAGIEAAVIVRLGQIYHGLNGDQEALMTIWNAKTEVEREAFRSMVTPIIEAYIRVAYDELASTLADEIMPARPRS